MSKKRDSWTSTITSITNPLKFFALALLMVEALIAALSAVGSTQVLTLSLLATLMFVLVVVAVVWLVAKHPEALLARRPSDLAMKQNEVIAKMVRYIRTLDAERKLSSEPLDRILAVQPTEDEVPVSRAPPRGRR